MVSMTHDQVNRHFAKVGELAKGLKAFTDGENREGDLHDQILADCRRRGWIALHGRMDYSTSRTIGEPDFTILADKGRTFFIECKSKTGKVSKEQAALHAWAEKLGHAVKVVRSFQEYCEVVR